MTFVSDPRNRRIGMKLEDLGWAEEFRKYPRLYQGLYQLSSITQAKDLTDRSKPLLRLMEAPLNVHTSSMDQNRAIDY